MRRLSIRLLTATTFLILARMDDAKAAMLCGDQGGMWKCEWENEPAQCSQLYNFCYGYCSGNGGVSNFHCAFDYDPGAGFCWCGLT